MSDFFFEETWAGYKELEVGGKKIAFVYGWQEVEQAYLSQVKAKYPDIFELVDDGGGSQNFLKIKSDAFEKITLDVLLDVVDNDTMDWFELVDLESKKLLNTSKNGEFGASIEVL